MSETPDDLTRIPMFDDEAYTTVPPPAPPPRTAELPVGDRLSPPATRNGWSRLAAAPEPERRSRLDDPTAEPETPTVRPVVPDAQVRRTTPGGDPDAINWDAVDWDLVAALRVRAASQLSAAMTNREGMDEETRRELGRKIILDLVQEQGRDADYSGRGGGITPRDQMALAAAIEASLFGLGRLQPLVDNESIENIEGYGCDDVLLIFEDGRIVRGPAVADSDEQLIADLQFFASRSGGSERSFSPSIPNLDLKLPGNHRLSANAWVSPRPNFVIRRHRLVKVSLEDLVERDMLTPGMASFLRACVRAKKSILVSGPQGSGKTTMVRALCECLDPWEAIATIETEYELLLHEMDGRHRRVMPFEARPGSGEKDAAGRRVGEVTLDDLMYNVLRKNRSRIIVGEVRGLEVLPMLEAMQAGAGSLSTIHATSARGAASRLVGLALKGGGHIKDYAASQVAGLIDVIVQIKMEDHIVSGHEDSTETTIVGTRERFVSEIVYLEPGEERQHGWAFHDIYAEGPDGRAHAKSMPEHLAHQLEPYGFVDPAFGSLR